MMLYFKRKLDFPARYVLVALCFFGYIVMMAMRINLSVAIVSMVNNSPIIEVNDSTPLVCRELSSKAERNSSYSKLEPQREFNWNRNTQSYILGAVSYGVLVSRLPGGMLADRWSAKWTVGLATFFGSLLTLLSPVAARWNVNALIALRVILGLTQGVMLSSFTGMIGRWAPKMERSRMFSIIISGSSIGTVVGLSLSGFLIKSNLWGGWPSAFYVIGLLGCVWCAFWFFLIHDKPEEHPRISPSELLYITENKIASKTTLKVPWLPILTSIRMFALIVTHFGHVWCYYTVFNFMPSYLGHVLHISIEKNGLLSSLPYLLLATTTFSAGYAADKLRQKGKFSITAIRKTFSSVAFFGLGLFMLLVVFVGCRPAISIALFCLSLGFNGANAGGFMVTHVDMCPQFAGILSGLISTIGESGGFLASYTAGRARENGETLHNWGIVFGISAGIAFVSGLSFDLFGSSELQPWMEDQTSKAKMELKNGSERKNSTTSDKTNCY